MGQAPPGGGNPARGRGRRGGVIPVMLEHVACPHCNAPNLKGEVMCFACGQPLGKRPRARPEMPVVPWVLWLGAVFGLVAFGLFAFSASQWVARYRQQMGIPDARMFALAGILAVAGQVALYWSRREDHAWWELKRAPELPLAQAQSGDAVWIRGAVKCETPLAMPYAGEACVYYRLVVQERDYRGRWRMTERDTKAVDFAVAEEAGSIYVPSGGVLFDAPPYVNSFLADGTRIQVWAIVLETPLSVCGRVDGDGKERIFSRLSAAVPAVATWRLAADYLAELARRSRLLQWGGWAASLAAALVLIATLARE